MLCRRDLRLRAERFISLCYLKNEVKQFAIAIAINQLGKERIIRLIIEGFHFSLLKTFLAILKPAKAAHTPPTLFTHA